MDIQGNFSICWPDNFQAKSRQSQTFVIGKLSTMKQYQADFKVFQF